MRCKLISRKKNPKLHLIFFPWNLREVIIFNFDKFLKWNWLNFFSVSSQLTHNSSNSTSSAGDSSQIPRKRIRLYTNDSQDLEATEDKKPDVKPDVKSGQNQNRSFEEIVRLNSNVQFVQRVELNEIQRPIIVAPPPPQITLAPQPSPSIQRTLATSSSNLPPTQENREQAVKIENIVSFRCLYAYYLCKNYCNILKPHLEDNF